MSKKLVLPQRMVLGRQILHRQRAGLLVLAEDGGSRTRHGGVGTTHPTRFVKIARHRGAPVGSDAQLRQSAFYADRA
jgi:hypothetical protein